MLDAIDKINQQIYTTFGNPETITRIAQYEMAFRTQMDATDAMDIHKNPIPFAPGTDRSLANPVSPTIAW